MRIDWPHSRAEWSARYSLWSWPLQVISRPFKFTALGLPGQEPSASEIRRTRRTALFLRNFGLCRTECLVILHCLIYLPESACRAKSETERCLTSIAPIIEFYVLHSCLGNNRDESNNKNVCVIANTLSVTVFVVLCTLCSCAKSTECCKLIIFVLVLQSKVDSLFQYSVYFWWRWLLYAFLLFSAHFSIIKVFVYHAEMRILRHSSNIFNSATKYLGNNWVTINWTSIIAVIYLSKEKCIIIYINCKLIV